MKRGDPAAEALHARRTALGMTMRDIEVRSRMLSESQPDKFEMISRGTISNIENEGMAFFDRRSQPLGRRRVNTLLEILYDGDARRFQEETTLNVSTLLESIYTASAERFQEETGLSIFEARAERFKDDTGLNLDPIRALDVQLPRPVPVYAENGNVNPQAIRQGEDPLREQVPALPYADLLLEITTDRNAPVIWDGQTVGVTLSAAPVNRCLNLLHLGGRLVLAWMVRPGAYAFTNGKGPTFGLGPKDCVVGHVAWIRPSLPLRRAG